MLNQQEIKLGFEYFVTGWHLIQQKGLRRFAVMPVLLNILLLGGLFIAFVFQIKDVVLHTEQMMQTVSKGNAGSASTLSTNEKGLGTDIWNDKENEE